MHKDLIPTINDTYWDELITALAELNKIYRTKIHRLEAQLESWKESQTFLDSEVTFLDWFAEVFPEECIPNEPYLDSVLRVMKRLVRGKDK
jgi:hypothetical protein